MDDPSPSALFHRSGQRAAQDHRGGQVQRQNAVPVVIGHVSDGARMLIPALLKRMSILPKAATAAAAASCSTAARVRRGRQPAKHPGARGPLEDGCQARLQLVGVARGDHHVGAGQCQRVGHGLPQAFAATGYQGEFAPSRSNRSIGIARPLLGWAGLRGAGRPHPQC